MNKRKVLVVATSSKTRGGITSVVKAHEKGPQWKEFHCHWVQTHRDGNSFRKMCYLIRAWCEYIALLPFYDIVHVHGTGGSSARRKIPFIKLAQLLKKKVIFHFHPSTEKILFSADNILLKTIFNKADMVLVLSPQWIRWIDQAFPKNRFNTRVLFNPCSKPEINPEFAKKRQILFAGSIIERKGYATLIKAFAQIANKYPDWHIVFAGNGEINTGIKIAQSLGIESQVEWLGWISGKEKDRIFKETSIYCLTSWGEGFPMGVLDAWSYGIPVISTPVGGITDVAEDGKNILLFPVNDVVALSSQLEKLITNDVLRERMGLKSKELSNTKFNIVSINSQLKQIYTEL